MSLAPRLRLASAAVIVAALGMLAAHAAPATAGNPLLQPDLKTIKPFSFPGDGWLHLRRNKAGDAVLRIGNRIANQGTGPLELHAGAATEDCEDQGDHDGGLDLQASQRIYMDGNANGHYNLGDPVGEEPQVGCFEFHPKHDHWHFQEFSQYALRDLKTGALVAGPSRKIGFCIIDGDRALPTLPGSSLGPSYPQNGGCGFGNPTSGPGVMGLSIGWADTYGWSTPGQRLGITGVAAGSYCLVSTANPLTGEIDEPQIIETDETNNARRVAISIKPAKKLVTVLKRGCSTL
jgi:Lysyl oxidase